MKKHAMMNYPNMHHYVCAVQIQTYTNTINSRISCSHTSSPKNILMNAAIVNTLADAKVQSHN